jgi:hypothetical protein
LPDSGGNSSKQGGGQWCHRGLEAASISRRSGRPGSWPPGGARGPRFPDGVFDRILWPPTTSAAKKIGGLTDAYAKKWRHRLHAEVTDGRHAAAIAFLRDYPAGSFVTTADGQGGALVTEAPKTEQRPLLSYPPQG